MRRERFYAIVVILLLLLNMGTLGYLFTTRDSGRAPVVLHGGEGGPHQRPEDIMIERLKLDDAQQEQLYDFIHWHRRSTDSVQHHIKALQKDLFALVQQDEMNVALRDNLLKEIEQCESAKHLITIQHFHDIRSMLKPEQKELFNEFMGEVGSRITAPAREGRRPPPMRK